MRRSKLNIIIGILQITRDGENKTAIVYKTNLNFKLAGKYLDDMIKRKFIEKVGNKYIRTQEGAAFLEKAKMIVKAIE